MGCCKTKPRPKDTEDLQGTQVNFKSVNMKGESLSSLHKREKALEIRQNTEENQESTAVKFSKPKMSSATKRVITSALRRHAVFRDLSEASLQALIEAMKHYSVNGKATVFKRGMMGVNYYIIETGEVEIILKGRRVKVLSAGESFGELALIQSLPRSVTVRTREPCSLWALEKARFNEVLKSANSAVYSENRELFEGVEIFQLLSESQRDVLISSLKTLTFEDKEFITRQGEIGEMLFIVKEGIVSCVKYNKEVQILRRGNFFGKRALLYRCAWSKSCLAVGDVKCLAINRKELEKMLGISLQEVIYHNSIRIAFSSNEALNKLSPEQQNCIIDQMAITSYKKSSLVIGSGTEMGEKLRVVVKGSLAREGSISIFAYAYATIGDNAIMKSSKGRFTENIIARENCKIAEISNSELERIIGSTLKAAVIENEMLEILKKCEILKGFSRTNLHRISTLLSLNTFHDSEVIFEQGSNDTNLYIIEKGTVEIVRDGAVIRTITNLDYFGEREILSAEPRLTKAVVCGNVTCWVLSQENLLSVVSQKVLDYIANRIRLQDEDVTLEQLAPVQVLGNGYIGIVTLVANKQTRTLYSLKSIPRWKIIAYDLLESVVQSKKVIGLLDHMFIVKSQKTFIDKTHIYYLSEFVRGLDFSDVLGKLAPVTDIQAKFYISSLVLALEHSHDRNIVYRNLKPDHIMVDDNGYLKLINFGTAKVISGRTFTIVGTPHYMAPEVIIGKGHNCLADYWSLGVMLFEILSGNLPFGSKLRNPFEVYEAILSRKIQYPYYIENSLEIHSLIEQLLSKNATKRIGESVDALKNHLWFNGFDWEKLTNKEATAPYIPEVPDYDSKITAAITQGMSVNDFLNNEERSDVCLPATKPMVEPLDWDANF